MGAEAEHLEAAKGREKAREKAKEVEDNSWKATGFAGQQGWTGELAVFTISRPELSASSATLTGWRPRVGGDKEEELRRERRAEEVTEKGTQEGEHARMGRQRSRKGTHWSGRKQAIIVME